MRRATQARDRDIPEITYPAIDRHSTLRARDVLHWTTNMQNARVVVTHKPFVSQPPTRQVRRQRVVPEVDRRLDEIVGQHTTSNDAWVAMIKLGGRQRHSGSNAAKNFLSHQAVGPWVEMTLKVPANLIVFIAKSVRVVRRVRIQE